jgi:hypothetical protein
METYTETFKGKEYIAYHGSPFDRGAADSYYGRGRDPHYYPNGSYNGEPVVQLTTEELEAYNAGFDHNEYLRNFKDWG